MTGVDWLIVGIVLLLGVFGWAQGFFAGALALAGFALGAYLGVRFGPELLPAGRRSPWAPACGLIGAVVAGGIFAAGLEGVGARVRERVRSRTVAALDGLAGAALTAAVGLGIAWILGALALASGGDARREAQRSAILGVLTDVAPPSRGLLATLTRLDPFPRVDGPEVRVDAPSTGIGDAAGVRAASESVVKILGSACGLGVEGSGWVAGPQLVVTNAHVVAGQQDTRVLLHGEGSGRRAEAVAFDPRNDVAVLRVPGLQADALRFAASTRSGTSGAILGFPENGPFDVRAGRLGVTREVVSQDAYGHGPVQREMTALRGNVRSGNSGGPMVDADGDVLTTVFAATTSGPRGGYGVPNAVVRSALARASGSVSTGPCGG